MLLTRRNLLVTAAAALPASRAQAQATPPIRIGVLTDMSGPYKDLGGPNLISCIRQAVQDSGVTERGINVEVLTADHQNKPDVGSAIARQWFDRGWCRLRRRHQQQRGGDRADRHLPREGQAAAQHRGGIIGPDGKILHA